ncbi:MAG: ORF2 [Torque teno virus AZ1_2]|nr:MAG: ORF2 [Torque teno virus AZ1_2]
MFLGRVWRKQKRKVLLLAVRTPQETSSMSIWRPPFGNVSVRERYWLQACEQSHATFCGCGDFVLHLTNLAARFALQGPPPPGGPPRPRPPLLRALPAPEVRRETRTENPGASGEPWPGDGGGSDAATGGRAAADGGDAYDPGDLEDLFAAVDEEQQ